MTKVELFVEGSDKVVPMVLGTKTCEEHIVPVDGLVGETPFCENFRHLAKITAAMHTGTAAIDWARCRTVPLPFTDELARMLARHQGH